MTTVYLVSCGQYSDYSIVGAFSTKELAQAMIDLHKEHAISMWHELNEEIEEYELDADSIQYRKGEILWYGEMGRDGSCSCYRSPYPKPTEVRGMTLIDWGHYHKLFFCVFALSAEHAIKIANERRAQLIANNEWPEGAEE